MIVNGIQCEVCTTQHIRDTTEKSFPNYIPPTWFTLIRGTMPESLHFCSKQCLREWLTERLTANDISLKGEDPKRDLYEMIHTAYAKVVSVSYHLTEIRMQVPHDRPELYEKVHEAGSVVAQAVNETYKVMAEISRREEQP